MANPQQTMSFDDEHKEKLDTNSAVHHVEQLNHIEGREEPVLVSNYASLTISQALRKFWYRYLVGLSVSMGAIYTGFTLTLPGSVIANQGFINQFGTVYDSNGNLQIPVNHVGAWNGINFGSQVLLQGLSPLIATKFGLKCNMYCLTLLITLAIILEIVAKDWKVYLVAKLVCGFASGFIGTTIPAYTSEITTKQFRGSHLSAFALFFAIGTFLQSIGMEILQETAPLKYRRAFYSEFAILGVWLPVMFFLPESPVWLIKNGKIDKAKKSLRAITGKVKDYDYEHEFNVFRQEVEKSEALAAKTGKRNYLACFKGPNLRRTLVSALPFTVQNFVGGPLMLNTAYFFQQIGSVPPFIANVVSSCILIFGTLCSFYLVDKVGRRPLMIWGCAVMCVCDMVVGGMGVIGMNKKTGSAALSMISVWVLAYSVSCGPIGWMALVENSTPVLRAETAGIAAVIQSLSGVVFNYCVPLMISDQGAGWGAKTGFFFGCLCVICVVVLYFAMPESKGRSYMEMDELFERRLPAWKFAKAKTSVQAAMEEEQGHHDV